jgi:maleate isomerase
MESALDHAVSLVVATGVDVIAYCDMVTTFIMEPGWNERTVDDIARRTGVKALSAWTALRDALAHFGARRIALGTPYPAAIHALAPPFFAARGLELGSHATMDIVAMREVPTIDKARLHAFVKTLNLRGCDTLVLLATDLPTFGSLDELEREFGLPILTSNQTLLWASLKAMDAAAPSRPLGRIFGA